ncbi:Hypothetical predicted protein [Marmota monax]|uniref:Uncharacterized protein n=1 Tax=Marmota monax TaxID=9995 RepID=A0A5E4BN34_MARMO|nr:hypothetical protein GHT09_011598 [Marmota monax]VTJ70072.1 Hypothetical predicted protein [Marmota monax]
MTLNCQRTNLTQMATQTDSLDLAFWERKVESQVLFETEISLKLLDGLNEDLCQKILTPIQQALKEGHLDATRLTGCFSRGSPSSPGIPSHQEFLGKGPNPSVAPDLAVVAGVAKQGLMEARGLSKSVLETSPISIYKIQLNSGGMICDQIQIYDLIW